jgi:hypothetical protein
MNPLTHSKNTTILPVLAAVTLVCFALSPQARATCREGCLFNGNTALGDGALVNNTGFYDTAIGFTALQFNTTGSYNTATGASALVNNTTGSYNTAIGDSALNFNTTASNNTANGVSALLRNTAGSNNTATGVQALEFNRNGSGNTANGVSALQFNTHGNNNIAVGYQAGLSLTTGSNNIDIGNIGVAAETNTIRIGTVGTQANTFIVGISGATVPTGVPVIVDANGHLGTTTSSARFKEAIKPMDKASEAILGLKPVTFRYKPELDPNGIPQFGLVAEQVEEVNPDLVARDNDGKPYTVRYDAVNAMLLNEFLKEHRKVAEQEATIRQLKAELQATATRQQKQIETLTAGLHRVTAQLATGRVRVAAATGLELSKTAPQMVVGNH